MRFEKFSKLFLFAFMLPVAIICSDISAEEIRVSTQQLQNIKDVASDFRNFDVARVTNFSLPKNFKEQDVELIPHDIRAKEYQQFENSIPLKDRSLNVTLFKSKYESASEFLRIALVEGKDSSYLSGILKRNNTFYSIEPSNEISDSRAYSLSAVSIAEVESILMACGTTHVPELSSIGVTTAEAGDFSGKTSRILQIATDADYEYVQSYGDAAKANARILTILNGVDAIYQNQFSLSFSVTFQNAWSTSADPYTSSEAGARVAQLRSYWESNFSNSKTYDLAHLWTGIDLDSTTVGIAYVDATCSSYRYGLSQLYNVSGAEVTLTAHEIGHNLSANHDTCSGSDSWVMCPFVVPNETIFSPVSKNQINSALPSYTCLSAGSGPAPSPSPSASASRSSSPSRSPSPGSSKSPSPSSSASLGSSKSPSASPSASPQPTIPLTTRYDFYGTGSASFAVYRAAIGGWYSGTISGLETGHFDLVQLGLHHDIPLIGDYDGDRIADRTVYRESNGTWYTRLSSSGTVRETRFGGPGITPIAGRDFDGDRIDDIAIYNPASALFYYQASASAAPTAINIGGPGYIPAVCDFNGDGKAEATVFNVKTGVWSTSYSGSTDTHTTFGEEGDIPLPGLFDSKVQCSRAIWRPKTGEWYIEGQAPFQWGLPGDVPLVADFDGDGYEEVAVWRPAYGLLYIRYSSSVSKVVQLGLYFDKLPQVESLLHALRNAYPNFKISKGTGSSSVLAYDPTYKRIIRNDARDQIRPLASGSILLEGDYDGDGKSDTAQFNSGEWKILTATGSSSTRLWGTTGDIPVSGDFDGDGKTDLVVYRPNDNGIFSKWYVLNSSDGKVYETQFGLSGDIPSPMDISGDGIDDMVVIRPGPMLWFARDGRSGGYLGAYQFGLFGDQPCQADYNGDGYDDLCVYRPGLSYYFIYFNKVGYGIYQWGIPGDSATQSPVDSLSSAMAVYRPSQGLLYTRTVNDSAVNVSELYTPGRNLIFPGALRATIP